MGQKPKARPEALLEGTQEIFVMLKKLVGAWNPWVIALVTLGLLPGAVGVAFLLQAAWGPTVNVGNVLRAATMLSSLVVFAGLVAVLMNIRDWRRFRFVMRVFPRLSFGDACWDSARSLMKEELTSLAKQIKAMEKIGGVSSKESAKRIRVALKQIFTAAGGLSLLSHDLCEEKYDVLFEEEDQKKGVLSEV